MIVAVTGTPGTGKTEVSKELARRLDYSYIDVNKIARSEEVGTEEDQDRGAVAVDTESLVEELKKEVDDKTVLDGHLSHFYPADLVVVLRCSPEELENRLGDRGWEEKKVEENLQAEALDVILQQAVSRNREVVEVDTTGKDVEETAELIEEIIEGEIKRSDYRPGRVSWSIQKVQKL